jgi:hypothetical protein
MLPVAVSSSVKLRLRDGVGGGDSVAVNVLSEDGELDGLSDTLFDSDGLSVGLDEAVSVGVALLGVVVADALRSSVGDGVGGGVTVVLIVMELSSVDECVSTTVREGDKVGEGVGGGVIVSVTVLDEVTVALCTKVGEKVATRVRVTGFVSVGDGDTVERVRVALVAVITSEYVGVGILVMVVSVMLSATEIVSVAVRERRLGD